MAEGLNKVMLLGNLGADPELRVTPGGQSVLKLRLATTESYLDKNNTRQERTEWHSITVWGKRGEALSRILAKGSSIFVEGGIRTSSYEKDGDKRYRTEIVANNIILAGRGKGTGDTMGDPIGQDRPAAAQRPSSRAPSAAPTAAPADEDFGYAQEDDIPF